MDLKLYYCADDNNVLSKTLTKEVTIPIVLLTPASKEKPRLQIHKTSDISESLPTYNYAYLSSPFNRYYYITDITSVSGHTWELSLEVDVLMSFKEEILKQNAIIERSTNIYNTYINDSSYVVQNRTRTQVKEFPSGFTSDTLILLCAG